jgi:glycosyltransferase involved in cell wall biosynthesis
VEEAGYEDVHFAYAGDGPALPDFRAAAARLGLRRFHFLGRREDVPALLKSCTVAAVPSVWAEAFGLTVAEAMAAGKPLVATGVGGIPELVDPEETGLLVPATDAAALARGIRRCLDDPDQARAMGERARRVAWERFSIERVADEIAALLRTFYRSRSGSPAGRP